MALHEGEHQKKLKEHERKEHEKMRARGGAMMEHEKKDETEDEETEAEDHEAGPHISPGRKAGGKMPARQKRKAGGAVKGEKPKHRPDKRARGGATADLHPETAAGHMSPMPFEKVGPKPDGGGHGMDRD